MQKVLVVLAVLGILATVACAGQPSAATETIVNVAGGSYTNVQPAQLNKMLTAKDFVLVNVHIPYEGELNLTDMFVPYDQIDQNVSKLPADKNAKLVLYCRSGRMSDIAAKRLIELGYTNVWNLDGGMAAWEGAGLPVIQNKK